MLKNKASFLRNTLKVSFFLLYNIKVLPKCAIGHVNLIHQRFSYLQWIAIPEEVRTPSAVEKLLRSQPWGGWLAPGRLTFLRDGFEISDSTVCMVRADVIKVALADELYTFAEGSASELHHRAQDAPRAPMSRNAAGSDPVSGVGVSGHPLCGEGDHSAPCM